MKINRKFFGLPMLTVGWVTLSLMAQLPTIPPSVMRVTPSGVKRGATAMLTIEGRSLAGASAVLFDTPGLTAKVLEIRDLPEEVKAIRPGVDTAAAVAQGRKQEAKLELAVAPDVEPGMHWFRVETPLGTSNLVVLDVGRLPEIWEVEPNDAPGSSQRVELPATLMGTVGQPGDVDSFEFEGKAGQEMVFQTVAASLGSELKSVLVLRDATGKELARAGEYSRMPDAVLTFKLPADGKYSISISDFERRGSPKHFYRLHAGALPYLTGVFPLGVRVGESAEVEVTGVNLGEVRRIRVSSPAAESEGWRTVPLRVKGPQGEPLNKLMLAVGQDPEILEVEPNDSPAQAQRVSIPVTVNGRIYAGAGGANDAPADEDYYRFVARKGEHLTVEVAAARLGSPLDSVVEVLDGEGREIPQATLRSVAETTMTLAGRDSQTPGFRVASRAGLHPSDYLMVDDELVQISFIPDQPDADILLKNSEGQRIAFLNTSPQAHPVNAPIYKVQIVEPDGKLPANGLPVFRLTLRNDDGGPAYGADSRLDFVVPRDGDYLLRIKDVRGLQGEDFAYRLQIHDSRPDFILTAIPANPNVPRGGRVPVTVTANRLLGYDGPIEVEVKGLPKGITAKPATIPPGQDSTVIIVESSEDSPAAWAAAVPYEIVGTARVGGRELARVADAGQPLRVVAVVPPPDVLVAAEPKQIALSSGQTATVTVHVRRMNGFRGRVPCQIVNLPPGIDVVNLGLNGVLVPESETSRAFTLRAEDWASPVNQPFYVVATVESNSPTLHASAPIDLRVSTKQVASAGRMAAASNR